MRKLEEQYHIGNYLTEAGNCISAYQRAQSIRLIFDVCQSRNYKHDTLFVAVQIFDRYMYSVAKGGTAEGDEQFSEKEINEITFVALILAAKLQ